MCTDADRGEPVPYLLCGLKPDSPGGNLHLTVSGLYGRDNVLAAGENRRRDTARICKQFLGILDGEKPSPIHHGDPAAHVVGFFSAVCHHQHLAPEALQHIPQLDLQRVAQVGVQRRERLVQHQHPRLVHKDPCQGDALLLAAGELGRTMVFQSFQLHQLQHLRELLRLLRPVLFPVQAAEDILPHRHVREECVVLEQIADLPLLGREVDVLLGIIEHYAVQFDMPAVRFLDPGDALERKALAAAGGTQQAGDSVLRFEGHIQRKGTERSVDIDDQTHAFTAFFCLASSMFTVSSTTVLMARLIRTQNMAPLSSLVRQS